MTLDEVYAQLQNEGEAGEWLSRVIERGGRVRAFLFRYDCWKKTCRAPGWALFLQTEPDDRLVVEAARMFHFPGVGRQLASFLKANRRIAQQYGSIEVRFSGSRQDEYLSQGCRACGAIFGTAPLYEHVTLLWGALIEGLGAVPDDIIDDQLIHAFTLNLEGLFGR